MQANQSKLASKLGGSDSLKHLDLCLALFGACWKVQYVLLFIDEANDVFFYFMLVDFSW